MHPILLVWAYAPKYLGVRTRYFYLGLRTVNLLSVILIGLIHPLFSVWDYAPYIYILLIWAYAPKYLGLRTRYFYLGFYTPITFIWVYAPVPFIWVYAPFVLCGFMHPLFYVGSRTCHLHLGLRTQ
jgi:hypothetical protein